MTYATSSVLSNFILNEYNSESLAKDGQGAIIKLSGRFLYLSYEAAVALGKLKYDRGYYLDYSYRNFALP